MQPSCPPSTSPTLHVERAAIFPNIQRMHLCQKSTGSQNIMGQAPGITEMLAKRQ